MKTRGGVKDDLLDYLRGLSIIDAHEHLPPEREHLATIFNFFHLFIPYIQYDLYASGMPREWLWTPPEGDDAVDRCWRAIAPLWKTARHGSYARALLLSLKEFWGVVDITDHNYRDVAAHVAEDNRPGLYRRTLREKCRIRYALTQNGRGKQDDDFLKGGMSFEDAVSAAAVAAFAREAGAEATVDDFADHVIEKAEGAKAEGAALVKFYVPLHFRFPLDREAAAREFEGAKGGGGDQPAGAMKRYLAERLLDRLPGVGLVAAVHSGVWGDIREQHPGPLYEVVDRHPETAFDIYHMGMPFVHECGFLAKNFHNAYLNLCWSHIVAPEMAIRAIDEYIDYIPINKIFGFGGDYTAIPQKVWGHLEMARENLAEAFARRIGRGALDPDGAREILRLWMHDNPARVYGLG